MSKIAVLLFILTAGNIFALGNKQAVPGPHLSEGGALLLEQPETARAERVMKALAAAYPRQIDKIEFHNNDWAVLLRDTWYYYAEGKLLPENLLENAATYSRQPFYNYPEELPPWREPKPEEITRFREWDNMRKNSSSNRPLRSTHFFDDLWRVHNRDESSQRLQTFHFLGKSIYVHYLILEELALVEEHILAAAKTDPQVQSWIKNIDMLHAWTWRNIAESQNRSFHSYGLAIDILPKSLGGKETYWLWTANSGTDWWDVPYNKRFHPPDAVIKAFEKFGFAWGGKWPQYDTMHFEYRPDILILHGLPPEMRR